MLSYSEGTLPPCLLNELPSTFKIFIGVPLAGTGDDDPSIDIDVSCVIISPISWYPDYE